ncbi:hypothetical protein [uncultured Helicobacter sp.]|uniref:hypothetical protein n=1 Tax=uncultured Helicobacter sp. TaxID=175537 RepID=UPI001C3AD159|nr:hypothetical protein [Candidatus Helicobacter avicola]
MRRAFVAFEMLWSIVIFGIVGIACMSVALHFTRFIVASSPERVLDSHIALLRIQNLLAQSVDLHLSSTSASFLLLDSERLLGYGDRAFANARFFNDTLLPQVPIEIFAVQGDEIVFSSSFAPNSFMPNQSLVLVCQSAVGSEDFIEFLAKVVSVGNDRLRLDSAPSSLCRAALPLQDRRVEISHHHDTLWLNQEILLENVRDFTLQLHPSNRFVSFRFCVWQRCFEGGSFVGVKAAFL